MKNAFLFGLLIICKLLFAQQNIKSFGVREGLSSASINCIFTDSRGFTWIGTADGGVCRYDGFELKVYAKNTFIEGTHLISNNVNCINEDSDGNIWIGTTGGVSCFDGIKFKNFDKQNGLNSNEVYGIAIAGNKVCLATRGAGIAIFEKDQINFLNSKNGLADDSVFCIEKDRKGALYFGTQNHGILKYQNGKYIALSGAEKLNGKVVFCLKVDSNDVIWAGSVSGNFYKVHHNIIEEIPLPNFIKQDFIGSITIDKNNHKWIATEHGALKYNENSFTVFDKSNKLVSDYIQSLACDIEGNIWIGTNSGINVLGINEFILYNESNNLQGDITEVILKNKRQQIILSTLKGGLYQLENQYVKPLLTNSLIDKSVITAYAKLDDNTLVFGAENKFIFVDNDFNFIKTLEANNINVITKIDKDEKGNIYGSSYGTGICKFNLQAKAIKQINTQNSNLPSDNVLTIKRLSDNNFAVGYFNHDATFFNGEKAIPILCNTGTVYCIENSNDIVFFGTGEKGIAVYEKGKSYFLNTNHGLVSNNIQFLKWDANTSRLWVGTNKGINIIPFNSKMKHGEIINLAQKNSPASESMLANAIFKDGKTLWIGSLEGLLKHTEENQNYIPQVFITEVKVNNQFFDWQKNKSDIEKWNKTPQFAELNYHQNHLNITFAAATPNVYISYQYYLEGYEKKWSSLVNTNEVIYSNIPPGKYTFKVRASTANGAKGKITSFEIYIVPPLWMRWWFWGLIFLSMIVVLFLYIRFREKNLVKEKKYLEATVIERTVELYESNNKLKEVLNDIQDSINYARNIQNAILPGELETALILGESFVIYKPKDIVSGDFYWVVKKENMLYFAAVDCTGHGVPGAFMSMIGFSILNEIINKKITFDTGIILQKLNSGVIKALKQNQGGGATANDGMDLSLCSFDIETGILQYSGAKRPLIIVTPNEKGLTVDLCKTDKISIGGIQEIENPQFTTNEIHITKGTTVYLFSDGIVDQFGGEKNKKFSTKKLVELIEKIQTENLPTQKKIIEKAISVWMGDHEQIDDILLMGVKF